MQLKEPGSFVGGIAPDGDPAVTSLNQGDRIPRHFHSRIKDRCYFESSAVPTPFADAADPAFQSAWVPLT